MRELVPAPVSARPDPDQDFRIGASTLIRASGAAAAVGEYLAELLRPATGYPLPVVEGGPVAQVHGAQVDGAQVDGAQVDGAQVDGAIALVLDPDAGVGEAYRLRVRTESVVVEAGTEAGLFAGVQTLRQLLPAAVNASEPRPGPWTVSGGSVGVRPRFTHRGAMLGVARHFVAVAEAKRFQRGIPRQKLH